MTTIVYHAGIIAYESHQTAGDVIVDYDADKKTVKNNVPFIFCGATCDQDEIIKGYFGEEYDKNADASAIVADSGKVFLASVCKKDGFWKMDITGRPYCLGSGERFAWAALDCGCDAKGAVAIAIKRDVYSGGKIRTLKVF